MKRKNRETKGFSFRTVNTLTREDGCTVLQKTGDEEFDYFLSKLEDGLSFLYYSQLENENGTGDKEDDFKTGAAFLEEALAGLKK